MRKTVYNTSKAKVNDLENSDASTLIQTNQYNTDKQNLEEKIGDVENTMPDINGLMSTKLLIQKPVK